MLVKRPRLGFDDIGELVCMDEKDVWFLLDNLIYRFEEVVIDLLLPEVFPAQGIEAVERG